ncbi:MAG: outer membrane beta-barrel protein [Hyphomicrobiaceae bacterium]
MTCSRLQFCLAFAVLWSTAGGSAHAQKNPEGIGGRPWVQSVQPRQTMRPTPVETSVDVEPSSDDPAVDNDPARPAIRGSLTGDGDPASPTEPVQPVDGIVTQPDADRIETAGTNRHDLGTQTDVDAFDRPRAGFDPDAFSIEPEPSLDRRPERRFRRDPFDPTGIRMGSFMILPEAELAAAAYSNVFRGSQDPLGDAALEFRPSVRAVSMWSRHALELRAEGNTSFHKSYASEDDRAALLEARGRIDLTRRTNIEALAAWERAQEMRGSIDVPLSAVERGDVESRRAAISVNHRSNRLALQLRGSLAEFDYAPVATLGGGEISNADRDYIQQEAALRASWLLKSTLSAFAETSVNIRDHTTAGSDGIKHDSHGTRHRIGLSFGGPEAWLHGQASIGYGQQTYDVPLLLSVEGILVDANLVWRVSGLTSLLLTARTDVEEASLAGIGGALARSVGAEVRHAFRRNLVGTAGVRFARSDYQGADFTERELVTMLGLEYILSREVTLFGGYRHIAFDSTDEARNYNADEVRVGVRLRR